MTRTDESTMLDGLTAEALAQRVQEGSKAAFAELANRFGPRLFSYFRQKIGRPEDCEDLVQDTLVKAYQNIHRYRNTRVFSTWLYTIGTRRMLDFFRVRDRTKTERLSEEVCGGGNPFDSAVRRDERSRLWAHASTLPPKQYDALWLRYAEDMPLKEIAGVLGTTRVHVKVLLFRARARLANLEGVRMEKQEQEEGKETVPRVLSRGIGVKP